jgi:phosphopantetheinyl transferase
MSFLIIVDAARWNPTHDEWLAALQLVSEEESARIMRFKRPRDADSGEYLTGHLNSDAKQSLMGRLMIHHLITRALGCVQSHALLKRTPTGKPIVVGSVAMRVPAFNVAHVGDLVCLLHLPIRDSPTSLDAVGVDLVQLTLPVRRTPSLSPENPAMAQAHFFESFERDVFTPNEWRVIYGDTVPFTFDQRCVDLFFVHWALKEAYVKYTGAGLALGLTRVEFQLVYGGLQTPVVYSACSALSDAVAMPRALFARDNAVDLCTATGNGLLPVGAHVCVDGAPVSSVSFRLIYGTTESVAAGDECFRVCASLPALQRSARALALYCVAMAVPAATDDALRCCAVSCQPMTK